MVKKFAPELDMEQISILKRLDAGTKIFKYDGFFGEMQSKANKRALWMSNELIAQARERTENEAPLTRRTRRNFPQLCFVIPKLDSGDMLIKVNHALVDLIAEERYTVEDVVVALELPVYEGTVTFSEALHVTEGAAQFYFLKLVANSLVRIKTSRDEVIKELTSIWGYPYDYFLN